MARLLWRGSFSLPIPEGGSLHGLAIVAPSFHLSAAKCNEDDPFSSSNSSYTARMQSLSSSFNAELCLDLEMMRNRPLLITHERVTLSQGLSAGNPITQSSGVMPVKLHGRKALKQSIEMLRKGKSHAFPSYDTDDRLNNNEKKDQVIVHLDLPVNHQHTLLLYIDQRCLDTVTWFNENFCQEPVHPVTRRTTIGSLITFGEENELLEGTSSNLSNAAIVVYGMLVEQDSNAVCDKPIMQLCVARLQRTRGTGPRPDDPAPRGELFLPTSSTIKLN